MDAPSLTKSIILPGNPLNKKDIEPYVLLSHGNFDLCRSLDGKNFYLIANYGVQIREDYHEFFFIAKAPAPRKDFYSHEIVFQFPINEEELKAFQFYDCRTGKKIEHDDLYIIQNDRGAMLRSYHIKDVIDVMRQGFFKIETFADAEAFLKKQAAGQKKIDAKSKTWFRNKCRMEDADAEYWKRQALIDKRARENAERQLIEEGVI